MRLAVLLLFAAALSASAGDHGAERRGHSASPRDPAWAEWDALAEAYERLSGRSERDALFEALLRRSLASIPRVQRGEGGGAFVSVTSGMPASRRARAMIRLNLRSLKGSLVDKLLRMLEEVPPRDPATNRPLRNPALFLEVANQVADEYIRATDEFLRTHPGARPELGKRNFLADAVGLQNEFNSPWCADWAKAMLDHMNQAFAAGSPVNRVFRFQWGQSHARRVVRVQHNYLVVYPWGNPPDLTKPGNSLLLFDPWRDILPRAYFPDDSRWYAMPTNLGIER